MPKIKQTKKVKEKAYAIVRGNSIFCGPALMLIFHPIDKWKAERKLEEMDEEFKLVECEITYTLSNKTK